VAQVVLRAKEPRAADAIRAAALPQAAALCLATAAGSVAHQPAGAAIAGAAGLAILAAGRLIRAHARHAAQAALAGGPGTARGLQITALARVAFRGPTRGRLGARIDATARGEDGLIAARAAQGGECHQAPEHPPRPCARYHGPGLCKA